MNQIIQGESFFHGFLKEIEIKENDETYTARIQYNNLLNHEAKSQEVIVGKISSKNEIYKVLKKAQSNILESTTDRNLFLITGCISADYMECLRIDKYVRTLILRAEME